MNILASEENAMLTKPFVIYLMNAYSVHTAEASNEDVIRTFFRLEFSELVYDRVGNSKNPFFSYNWIERDCRCRLI